MKLWAVYEVIDGSFNTKLYAICDSEDKALDMYRNSGGINLKVGRDPFILNEQYDEKDWSKRYDDERPKLK